MDPGPRTLVISADCHAAARRADCEPHVGAPTTPHAEGTWPNTKERLRETFRGVPADEVKRMLGGNAARVYGFDEARLAPLVARIGPEVATLALVGRRPAS